MYVRLAFAVAINVEPEILIIDEALSVGDMRFQLKCFRKLEEIKEKGTTILFVTHDTGSVINHCDRAIWLNEGKVKEEGIPESVCKHYMSFMAYDAETTTSTSISSSENHQKAPVIKDDLSENKNIPWKSVAGCESFGEGGAEITHVAFYDAKTMKSLDVLKGGEAVCLGMKVKNSNLDNNLIAGFIIYDKQGNHIYGTNTHLTKVDLGDFKKNNEKDLFFIFKFPFIKNGDYIFSVAIGEGTMQTHQVANWIHDAKIVKILNSTQIANAGYLLVDKNITIKTK
jgi:ABC-type glutathione transport system ATPase component